VLVVAAIAVTAAITAAIVKTSPQPLKPASAPPSAPQYSAAEQESAKQNVCHVFDLATSGQQGQGGMRSSDGQLNMPLAFRTLNGVVAIQDALSGAVPQDVSDAAHRYMRSSLELTTASMSPTVSADEGNKLNDASNSATFAFADVCGLPH
jgi:hypothetical protein